MATAGTAAAVSRSSTVSAVGVMAKSCRLLVRVNAPGTPANGLAITRPMPRPMTASSNAISQMRYSSGTGMTDSCAAI